MNSNAPIRTVADHFNEFCAPAAVPPSTSQKRDLKLAFYSGLIIGAGADKAEVAAWREELLAYHQNLANELFGQQPNP